MVADSLVGPGWFELIPVIDLDIIYEKRYPPLWVKPSPDVVIEKTRWERYRQLIQAMLDLPSVLGREAAPVSLKIMLCEGLNLLHFTAMMANNRFPGSEELRGLSGRS